MDGHLERQMIDYYRARAPEYDEWFERRGRYDQGAELNRAWFDEAAAVRAALHAIGHAADALELAGGTGIWTAELARLADRVTVVDASTEMIAINRARVASDRVSYVAADLFAWEPARTYDLVFFGFWLSHVPPERLDEFLARVARATQPGGRLFLVDSRPEPTSTTADQPLPGRGATTMTRRLNDGRTYTIVKVFYEPATLEAVLGRHGFDARAWATERYFVYASATRR
ncbi:MAG TPA: class I SAM-dependent methyltransferase [Thermomicrobiaceae bacterium]|nr:class I SAM-dependent methyltransferase [Thermomicrobiaceae bacterium]